jgi:hypothetical protein
MGHLLSSALKMQGTVLTQLQYSFANFVGLAGNMNIAFNGSGINLNTNTGLTTVTLSPGSQTISSNVTNTDDTGTNIDYYINDSFIESIPASGVSNTGDITTSAGNTYKFVGSAG